MERLERYADGALDSMGVLASLSLKEGTLPIVSSATAAAAWFGLVKGGST